MAAGGRWNPIGTPMRYAARYLSLACVEVLVHLDKCELPRDCVWSTAKLLRTPRSMQFGVRSVRHLAVQVPSAVIPEECNILLNPNHTEHSSVLWSEPRTFRFDPRLFIAEPETL